MNPSITSTYLYTCGSRNTIGENLSGPDWANSGVLDVMPIKLFGGENVQTVVGETILTVERNSNG